jgi:hypothetical protein
MRNVGRKLAFVLAASNHGTMITNRFDYRINAPNAGVGVGYQLLEAGAFDPIEVELALQLIESRRRIHGAGVVAIDCGANIGIHTIEWATAMTGCGSVIFGGKPGQIANKFRSFARPGGTKKRPGYRRGT